MPGKVVSSAEKLVEPLVMGVHVALRRVRDGTELKNTDQHPEFHCYALSTALARVLAALNVPAEVVIGYAVGTSFGQNAPTRCAHTWLKVDGALIDPKRILAGLLVRGFQPTYESYERAPVAEVPGIRQGFENYCGLEDGVYDAIAEAFVKEAA